MRATKQSSAENLAAWAREAEAKRKARQDERLNKAAAEAEAELLAEKEARRVQWEKDRPVMARLFARLNGRTARPARGACAKRARTYGYTIRRDPRDVAWRWLRRFVGGAWYLGGAHVARHSGGPGIGFMGFVNDRAKPIRAVVI